MTQVEKDLDRMIRFFVWEWCDACLEDDERKECDEIIKRAGYSGGLSEDTFYALDGNE